MLSDCLSRSRYFLTSDEPRSYNWNWITGLLFIFLVTVIWTIASYLTRYIYLDLNFQSPFLLTYFSSSFFVLYLPLWQLWIQFGWVLDPPSRRHSCSSDKPVKNDSRTCTKFQKRMAASLAGDDIASSITVPQFYTIVDEVSDTGIEEGERSVEKLLHLSNSSDMEDAGSDTEPDDTNYCASVMKLGFFKEAFSLMSFTRHISPESEGSYMEMTGGDSFDLAPQCPSASASASSDDSPLHAVKHSQEEMKTSPSRRHSEAVQPKLRQYSHTHILSIAIVLCPLWFIANCCYKYALLYTSVANSTVISNLSGGFTLLFSWLYGVEKITCSKILGLSICFLGLVALAVSDSNHVDQSTDSASTANHAVTQNIFGDIMAVLGAVGYGLYTTILRVKIADDESASMQLLLGYMGLVNAVLFSPAVLMMAIMNWDHVRQLTWTAFGLIFVSGFFDDVISDYLWARSILLTSPTVATVGLSLTIPMAVIVDFFTTSPCTVSSSSLTGAVVVLTGFLIVSLDGGCKSAHLDPPRAANIYPSNTS